MKKISDRTVTKVTEVIESREILWKENRGIMVNITDKENRNVRNDYLPWYEKRHVTSSQKLKQSLPHIRNSRQTRRTFLPLQREHTHLGEWLLFISCMWWLLGNMGNLLLNTFFWYSYLYANIIAQVTWFPLSLHPILRYQ